jgi:hypothetical protein
MTKPNPLPTLKKDLILELFEKFEAACYLIAQIGDPIPGLSSCKELSALRALKLGFLAPKRTKSLAARDNVLSVDGSLQEDRLGIVWEQERPPTLLDIYSISFATNL